MGVPYISSFLFFDVHQHCAYIFAGLPQNTENVRKRSKTLLSPSATTRLFILAWKKEDNTEDVRILNTLTLSVKT